MFITVEGGEGGGKSTNLAFIEKYLKDNGKAVVVTREPGGTRLGEKIRHLLLDTNNSEMVDRAELLLVFAARAQHLAQVIRPALDADNFVLCDRFTDATYAYQGSGRGIAKKDIAVLEQWVQDDLRPDLTILLDLDVEIGMQRAAERGEKDRFEKQQLDFFRKVRKGYLSMAENEPQRYAIIDASKPLSEVQDQIKKVLEERI